MIWPVVVLVLAGALAGSFVYKRIWDFNYVKRWNRKNKDK